MLEGSVQRSGDRVRITVQLIDATTGHHLWAENYDREVKDIFALQDEIAMKIMAAMQVEIGEADWGRYSAIKTTNLKAYEKFLKGKEHMFLEHQQRHLKHESWLKKLLPWTPSMEVPMFCWA